MRLFMTRRFGQIANAYSLEPIYDKKQVDIRLFNILYWPSKEKRRHKFIKKSHLLRNDA